MLYPDHHTRRLLVDEHQAELRRDAQQPRRDPEADQLLTWVALSRPPARTGRGWLPWRRFREERRAAHAS